MRTLRAPVPFLSLDRVIFHCDQLQGPQLNALPESGIPSAIAHKHTTPVVLEIILPPRCSRMDPSIFYFSRSKG